MEHAVSDLSQAVSLSPGVRLGKYHVIRPLAIGGMAEVYVASADGLEGFKRTVVLKRILPQYSLNADFVKMFLNEARLTAMLDHPNIVQVHDIGNQGGSYYLTMEYVRGQDIRCILKRARRKRKPLPLSCVSAIGMGLAAGLHYAHDACDHQGAPLNIIHRDVSLSNVLVSYDGTVKVVDFGIAKAAASNMETRTGTIKGKLAYMSPEQCKGEVLDRRSDIFAIGVVLYEMVTGSRLFTGPHDFAILQKIIYEDVAAPSTLREDIPPELDRIILKALRRDREERYNTALELRKDLHAFARANQLAASGFELAEYMRECFADDIAAEPSDSAVQKVLVPGPDRPPSVRLMINEPTAALANGSGGQPVVTSMFETGGAEESLIVDWDAAGARQRTSSRRFVAPYFVAGVALAALAFSLWPRASRPEAAPSSPAALAQEHPSAGAMKEATKANASAGPSLVATPPSPVVTPLAPSAEELMPSPALATGGPATGDIKTRAPAKRRVIKKAKAKAKPTEPSTKKSWDANSALLPSL